MAEFLMVPLDEVRPDPNQPRKFFEEAGMKELTDSVREKGVIQAIVVRPNPDGGYMVVSGERRFRASMAIMQELPERNTIPALIRDLTDQEALELQIIENLQRKEVHPMEEAVAFKSLNQKLSTFEIAQKVGKSESYVLKRMKLTELVERAQKMFFANRMDYSEALKLSRFDEQTQMEILQSAVGDSYNWDKLEDYSLMSFITFGYRLNQKSVMLSDSSFDQFDVKLYPAAGSCIGCRFNSRTNPELFETKNPTCYRPSCFAVKSLNHKNNMIEEAQKDPSIVLVAGYVYKQEDRDFISSLKRKNITVFSENDYWNRGEVEESFMTWDQWCETEENDLNTMSAEEINEAREEYDSLLLEACGEQEKGEQKVKSGEWRKAFVVAGHYEGKFIYIEFPKVSSSFGNGSGPEVNTPAAEIVKIEMNENRAKELDFNKKWAKARQADLLQNKDSALVPGYLVPMEPMADYIPDQWRNAWYLAMWSDVYYYLPKEVREDFKEPKLTDFANPCTITDNQFLRMMRFWILKKLDAVEADGARKNTMALYEILRLTYPEQIAEIDSEIDLKANARQKRIETKIAALQLQMNVEKPAVKQKKKKSEKLLEEA